MTMLRSGRSITTKDTRAITIMPTRKDTSPKGVSNTWRSLIVSSRIT